MKTKLIPMTNDPLMFAVVDEKDYAIVSCRRWSVEKRKYTAYATTSWRDCTGKTINCRLHRFITGNVPGSIIDHIDRNGMNCTRENLRFVSRSENSLNAISKRSTPGVVWRERSKKYEAYIKARGKYKYIGLFNSLKEAIKARNAESLSMHGEFARLINE